MKPLRAFTCLMLLLAFTQPIAAASPDPVQLPPSHEQSFPPGPWRDVGAQLLAGALLTGLALSTEDPARAQRTLDRLGGFSDLDFLGSGWAMAAGIGGFGSYGYLGGRPGAREVAHDLAKAWALTSVTVGMMKVSINRRRPNGSRFAFPSGHTAMAFVVPPLVMERYGWKAGLVACVLATGVAAGRMEEGKHFLSDVIAGAAIGAAAGTYIAFGRSRVRIEAAPGGAAVGATW